jgi:aminoglycoside phosphotransferase (APT) family kinase protein
VTNFAPDPRLTEFLRDRGLVQSGEEAAWTPLAGGISSDIWRVDLPGRSLCIKCALPRLKVGEPWQVPVERNAYEWEWINFAAAHCPDSVPAPIANDPVQGIFAMSFLDPARHPVWKQLLLDGVAEPPTAARVAAILARIHAASAGDAQVARRFPTDAIFFAIRLEPYLLATARRHPDLEDSLRALCERTAQTRLALVHGDVSPKNILLGPKAPILLDAECAWYGDPAFDAAFCLNHFLLKCVARPQWMDRFLACYAAFSDAYLAAVAWEPRAEIERRTASLLPALFLARVDGKSPVEYITDERDKRMVRETARALVVKSPARLVEIAKQWRERLERARAG